jgi:peptide deformylase
MILPVYVYGHPVLRKKSMDITMDYPKLQELIADMFETMYHDQGVGLAAPQIGKPVRIFVIDTSPYKESFPDTEILKEVFINPLIKNEFGNDFTFNEGCLSIPDLHADVTRKSEIEISYLNEKGIPQVRVFNGLVARVIQHEYDHLEGKMFIDYLPAVKKMVIKRKLSDIASGKHKPFYRSISAK